MKRCSVWDSGWEHYFIRVCFKAHSCSMSSVFEGVFWKLTVQMGQYHLKSWGGGVANCSSETFIWKKPNGGNFINGRTFWDCDLFLEKLKASIPYFSMAHSPAPTALPWLYLSETIDSALPSSGCVASQPCRYKAHAEVWASWACERFILRRRSMNEPLAGACSADPMILF